MINFCLSVAKKKLKKKMKIILLIFVFISLFVSFNVMPIVATTTTGTDANGFTWQSDDGVTYSITGYNGSDTNITISSSIDGRAYGYEYR